MEMARYEICAENIERLQKKANTFINKAKKYNCDFTFNITDEVVYKKIKNADGSVSTRKFIVVEAEGKAIVNGWLFVGTIDHKAAGNIIRAAVEGIEVPSKYYTTDSICEHCNTKRDRKDTFLVMNTETKEFKQVGKSCLKDFTRGMDIALISEINTFLDDCEKSEGCFNNVDYCDYLSSEKILEYAFEVVKHFGYVKYDSENPVYCTKARVSDYFCVRELGRMWDRGVIEDLKSIKDFNPESNKETVAKAVEWINSQEETSSYIHNVKTLINCEYVNFRDLGILASLPACYNRFVERENALKAQKEADRNSEYIGNVGDKVDVNVTSWKCVTSWENQFGMTYVYRFSDKDGNVIIWKTSKELNGEIKSVKGTVKAQNVFRDIKQTELTRCKVA